MKKIFHLGMLALTFAIITTSCTKSKDSIAPSNGIAKARDNGEIAIFPSNLEAKVFDQISQPYVMQLGQAGSVLYENEQATFFILLSDEGTDNNTIPVMSTLWTRDATNGNPIQSFDFIHHTDPAAAGIVVPDDLAGRPFMFATVTLDNQYVNKTVTLHSSLLLVNGEVNDNMLESAFFVSQ